jgi:hypothetical protein
LLRERLAKRAKPVLLARIVKHSSLRHEDL